LRVIGADALARSRARCVTRLQTERLRSAKSYVADGTSAASSLLRGEYGDN
jgi:hypothetical protein